MVQVSIPSDRTEGKASTDLEYPSSRRYALRCYRDGYLIDFHCLDLLSRDWSMLQSLRGEFPASPKLQYKNTDCMQARQDVLYMRSH